MRIAVYGIGGASGYFGARLVEAGREVAFIARGEHLAAIRRAGLRVDSLLGDVVVRPALATDDTRDVGPVDCVLLGVKAWQVPEVARALGPLLGPATAVVPLQNGVEAPDQIAEAVGAPNAVGATARIMSARVGPGHVAHTGAAPTLELGELDGTKTERIVALHAMLAGTPGITASIADDIRVTLWTKLLFVASWGAIGALARAPVGLLRGAAESRELIVGAMREIEQVARARGIALARDVVDTTMAYLDALPEAGTPSMQRDIVAGLPSELDSLSGAVRRLGAAIGVSTPIHDFAYRVLAPLERRARGAS